MWTNYRVKWDFITQLCGSVPADPEIVKSWVDARKPRVRPPGSKSLDEINEEVLASIDRGEEFDEAGCNILTFQRAEVCVPLTTALEPRMISGGERGCCMRAATIKAHLKDCSRQLSVYVGRLQGERAFSTKVANGVYHDETVYWVPILRPDGTPVTKHDGERDKPIRTRFGSALKRFEWIRPARMDFTLKVLTPTTGKPVVSEHDLARIMKYGGVHGYGGERSDGEGRYTFTLTLLGEE